MKRICVPQLGRITYNVYYNAYVIYTYCTSIILEKLLFTTIRCTYNTLCRIKLNGGLIYAKNMSFELNLNFTYRSFTS